MSMVELFLDSSLADEAVELSGKIGGVTTNPLLVWRQLGKSTPTKLNQNFNELKTIGKEKLIFLQTVSNSQKGIIEEAKALHGFLKNDCVPIIKIPVTENGLNACQYLQKRKIDCLLTAVYSKEQAVLAEKTWAKFIAVYVNRLNEALEQKESFHSGWDLLQEIRSEFGENSHTTILAASLKTPEMALRAIQNGAHSVTANAELVRALNPAEIKTQKFIQNHFRPSDSSMAEKLTQRAVKEFEEAADKSGYADWVKELVEKQKEE